jgi:lysophospholipase L1-like esterase
LRILPIVASYRIVVSYEEWLPTTQVFFVSIKPSRARHFQLAAQNDVNRRIAGLAAAREDVVFVDVASAMLGDDGARHDLFGPDGLHMNATGYAIWTDAIRHALVTRGTAAVERLEQMRRFAREHVVVLPRSAPQQSITNEP